MWNKNDFQNPPASFRGKPFWSWNGRLDKDELIRQVGIMKEMGFGGFFMHSRTGLKTEYLSDEWFELINACADEAERLGLEAWLYDEDRWPSGTAGGIVTENPDYRTKYLMMDIIDAEKYSGDTNAIATYVVSLENDRLQSYRKLERDERPDIGDKIAVFYVQQATCSPFYNGQTYLDVLNREATDAFLRSTHEKYKSHCGPRFGKSIKGIFTDEPNRGDLMMQFSGRIKHNNQLVPYTEKIFDEFKKAFGINLCDVLPELFFRPACGDVSQIKWQYTELLQRLLIENFFIPVNNWCKENDLLLTGHVLHEDDLTSQTAQFGSVMRANEYMGVPGVDFLMSGRNFYWVTKHLHSVARQMGKKWELSELYGCTGWHIPLQTHKAAGDWQAFCGVNLRCPHLSWYTMAGEAKRDCPGSIFHQSSWYKEYRYVEEYFARLGMILSEGEDMCDVLVINPVESVWAQVYPGWANVLTAQSTGVIKLEEHYKNLCNWLLEQHIDFDYGDEDILSRLGVVNDDKLVVGKAAYKTVVISGCLTLRSSTLKLLKDFKAAGGRVVFVGEHPEYIDCLLSDKIEQFAKICENIPFERESLSCLSDMDTPVSIPPHKDVLLRMKRTPEGIIAVVMNMSENNCYTQIPVSIRAIGDVIQLDCRNGIMQQIQRISNDEFILNVDLDRNQEVVFYIGDEIKECSKLEEKTLTSIEHIPLNNDVDYKLLEDNVCVLDFTSVYVDGDLLGEQMEILQADAALREHFSLEQRDGEMLQPWYKQYVLKESPLALGNVSLEFNFKVDSLPIESLYLVLEQATEFDIKVNGRPLNKEFTGKWWVDKCFDVLMLPTSLLQIGDNHLELSADYHEGLDIEAIYLLGKFGVSLEGNMSTLTALPKQLSFGDIRNQGLAFYGGRIEVTLPLPEYEKNCRYELDYSGFAGACVILSADKETGLPERYGGFAPFVLDITDRVKKGIAPVLELVLTRRNTFGPLHQNPAIVRGYSSGNFRTKGAGYTSEYMTVPAGFLEGITLIKSKESVDSNEL